MTAAGDLLRQDALAFGVRVVDYDVAGAVGDGEDALGLVVDSPACDGGVGAGHFQRVHRVDAQRDAGHFLGWATLTPRRWAMSRTLSTPMDMMRRVKAVFDDTAVAFLMDTEP